jgi:sulfonate transport system permease protein
MRQERGATNGSGVAMTGTWRRDEGPSVGDRVATRHQAPVLAETSTAAAPSDAVEPLRASVAIPASVRVMPTVGDRDSGQPKEVPLVVRLIVPCLVLVLWQVLYSIHYLNPRLFSSPWEVSKTSWDMVRDGTMVEQLVPSLRRALIGLGLGVLFGMIFGTLSGLWRIGEAATDMSVQILRSVPFVALTSLYIIWFGFGEKSKLLLIATACFFPMYINVFAGIRAVDGRLLEMAKTVEMSTPGVVRHVLVPGALPSALVGLRYAMTTSVLALVIAETINAHDGIGFLMEQARNYLDTPVLFTCLMLYCLLGIGADCFVRALSKRLLVWQGGFAGR